MWGNRYFLWDGSKFTERGNLNKTWHYRGTDTVARLDRVNLVGAARSAVAEWSFDS